MHRVDHQKRGTAEPAGFDQVQPHEPAPPAPPASDALTWHGITLYGAYDIWRRLEESATGYRRNGYNFV